MTFLLMATSLQGTFAQDTTFQVLAVDGDVQVKRAQAWLALEAGQSLSRGDMLKLNEGAYLGMVHHTGHTLAIDKKGTYEVDQLSSELGRQKLNFASKYSQLYVSMLNNSSASTTKLERSTVNSALNVYLPNSVDVFNDEVIIRWNDEDQLDGKYEVKLKNMFNEVLDVQEVAGSKTSLNFKNEKISSERLIIVSVNSKDFKDQKSSDYGMKQLTPEEAEPIARELSELKLEVSDDQSALDKLILASFYEQNSLLADALTSYERAIDLAPNVDAFRKAYDQFIFRNGLAN